MLGLERAWKDLAEKPGEGFEVAGIPGAADELLRVQDGRGGELKSLTKEFGEDRDSLLGVAFRVLEVR